MLSIRECFLLDLQQLGRALCQENPAESRRPGWLAGQLSGASALLLAADVPADVREPVREMFQTVGLIHSDAIGDPAHAETAAGALRDLISLGDVAADRGGPAGDDLDRHPAFGTQRAGVC